MALVAARSAMADNGVDCAAATSYDFITRTMGHVTYTLLRPTTTYDPYAEYLQLADLTVTVTATVLETVVTTSTKVLTVVTSPTPSATSSQTPLHSIFPQAVADFEKRDVLTVTVSGECGSLPSSATFPETAASGGPSTTTVSATSTTTATGLYSLTSPLGLSTLTTTSPATLATTITPSAPSGASSSEAKVTSSSMLTLSSSISPETPSSTASSFSSALSTQSSYTVPTVSESAPLKPTNTAISGSNRVLPALAVVGMALVFAI